MDRYGLSDVYIFLSNGNDMNKADLCKSNTSDVRISIMNQASGFLLKCTLKSVSNKNKDENSIMLTLNLTYSKTMSGHATLTQALFKKLIVKLRLG